MCNYRNCGISYPLDPVIKTLKICTADTLCRIYVDEFMTIDGSREFVLELDQRIINDASCLELIQGNGEPLPIRDKYGNDVSADQIVKSLALRERFRSPECPCQPNQFRMKSCYKPQRFVVLCDLPRSTFVNPVYYTPTVCHERSHRDERAPL